MGRAPCCAKIGLHRGQWTPKEDALLVNYIQTHGDGNWKTLPKKAGLLRCGKSCRLRWMNYLRPGVKRGNITPDEEELIVRMHSLLGNRWSLIAGRLPGRTDNEIKNYWNTHISKRLRRQGFDPNTHKKLPSKEGLSVKHNNKKSKESKGHEPKEAKVYLPKAVRVRGTALSLSEYISQQRDSDLFNGLEDGELRLLMDTFGGEDVRLLGESCEAFREEEVGEYSGVPWCDLKRSITGDGDLVNGSESEFEMGVANIIDKSLEHVYQEYMQLLNNNIEDQD